MRTLGAISASRRFPRTPGRSRRGAFVAEVAMAAVVLMIGMALTVKIVGFVASERRQTELRQRAILEVGNLMERLTGYPYQDISAELARKLSQPETTGQKLRGSELTVDVTESEIKPGRFSKRIAIRLRWRNRAGQWDAPVRLTSWMERPPLAKGAPQTLPLTNSTPRSSPLTKGTPLSSPLQRVTRHSSPFTSATPRSSPLTKGGYRGVLPDERRRLT
jgi:hypothetical protein